MRSTVVGKVLKAAATAGVLGVTLTGQALAANAGLADRAQALLDEGKALEARQVLSEAVKQSSGERRAELLELLQRADFAVRELTPSELRLQRGELMVQAGDLRGAEAQLESARRDIDSSIATRARAAELLDRIARERMEFQPLAQSVLAQAVADYRNESFAAAKAGFISLDRSGVKLTREQQRTLDLHIERIDRLEAERGERFDFEPVSLGVLADTAQAVAAAAVAETQPSTNPEEAQRAQQIFEQANVAFEEGRYAAAEQLYTRVIEMPLAQYLSVDELNQADMNRREARRLAGIADDEGDQVRNIRDQIELVRQQYTAEVENLVDRAENAIDRGDPDAAREAVAEAQLVWGTGFSGGYFNERENQAQQAEFDRLIQRINSVAEEIRITELEQQRIERQELEVQQLAAAEAERERRINDLLDQLIALQQEQKYEDALEVIDQILFLDPNNPTGLMMKRVIEDVVIYRRAMELRRERDVSIGIERNNIYAAGTVPTELLSFPEDWPQLSETRSRWSTADDFTESPADRAVLARVENTTMPAQFQNVTLENVIQFVASVTNLNVDVDWDSLSFIGIDRDTEVELDLTSEIPASTVLDRVLEKVSPDDFERAGWAVQDGIVIIASDADLRKNTFIVIYDVRDLIFEIPNFDNVPELDIDSVLGGGGGGGGGQSPFTDNDDDEGDDSPLGFGEEEEQNLDDLLEIIQENVDRDGWRANGGETGVVQPFQQYLVVTNTARNHREVRELLRQLREIRNIQITVESRFLTVSMNFFEQIGFDVDVLFNAQDDDVENAIRNQLLTQALVPGQGDLIPPTGTLPPGSISTAPGYYQPDPTAPPTFQSPQFVVPYQSGLGPVDVNNNSLGLAGNLFSGTDFAAAIINSNPALSIAGTFLDDIQVDFLIEATQADNRSVVLQAPRLTFTNGKVANISVATQQAFVSDLEPVTGSSAVAFDPELDTVSDGFTLIVGGVVSADRRFVTLAVEISFADIIDIAREPFVGGAGGDGDDGGGTGGGSNAVGFIDLPLVAVTQVNTGVTVPDRGTILLGGQRLSDEIEIETGVPVLSKLPVINRFFTNRITETREQTLMILIKPTIIIQGEEEERNFPGLQERLSNTIY